MHTPFQLNATNSTFDNNPIRTTFSTKILGIRSFPGLAIRIFINIIIDVKKNPPIVAAEANE